MPREQPEAMRHPTELRRGRWSFPRSWVSENGKTKEWLYFILCTTATTSPSPLHIKVLNLWLDIYSLTVHFEYHKAVWATRFVLYNVGLNYDYVQTFCLSTKNQTASKTNGVPWKNMITIWKRPHSIEPSFKTCSFLQVPQLWEQNELPLPLQKQRKPIKHYI